MVAKRFIQHAVGLEAKRNSCCGFVLVVCAGAATAALADDQLLGVQAQLGGSNQHQWVAHNRSLSVHGLQTNQTYQEFDTQGRTIDGIFNAEAGRWRGVQFQARWQGNIGQLPLWLQAQASVSKGQTDYTGYLQNGGNLTPFIAHTGNSVRQHSLRMGWPIEVGAEPVQAQRLQVVPYFDWSHTRWQRNLVQYGESYTYTTQSLGLLAQWQFAPQWVLEASAQTGRQTHAVLSAPMLGFASALGRGRPQQTGLALHYLAGDGWSLQLHAHHSRYNNGASATVNDLQAPPSTTRHTTVGAALGWHY